MPLQGICSDSILTAQPLQTSDGDTQKLENISGMFLNHSQPKFAAI